MFLIPGVEVDRCQQELREAAAGDQIGNGFTGVGEEDVWAKTAQHAIQLTLFETVHPKHTSLLDLHQEGTLFLVSRGHGH